MSATIFSLLIALIGIPSLLSGQEVSLPEYKCKLTLPKGWSRREISPEDRAASEESPALVAETTTGQALSLFIMEIPKHLVFADTAFTNAVERVTQARGITIVDRKQIAVAGVPAYAMQGQGLIDSVQVYVYAVFVVANGHGYSFAFTSRTNVEPSANPDVQGIIRSFKFIGKPERHVAPADMPPKKIVLRQHKFSITLPGGWEQLPRDPNKNAERIFHAADFLRLRIIAVDLRPKLSVSSVRDTAVVRAVREALEASGMSIGDHGFTKVAGREALWLRGTISSMGGSVQLLIVPANDMTYSITVGLRGGGDASADAVLKKVVESIRFSGK